MVLLVGAFLPPLDFFIVNVALQREYTISRPEQDEFAVRSHRRAAAARDEGRFAEELVRRPREPDPEHR